MAGDILNLVKPAKSLTLAKLVSDESFRVLIKITSGYGDGCRCHVLGSSLGVGRLQQIKLDTQISCLVEFRKSDLSQKPLFSTCMVPPPPDRVGKPPLEAKKLSERPCTMNSPSPKPNTSQTLLTNRPD